MSFIFDISISKNIYKNNLKKKNKKFLIFFKRVFETQTNWFLLSKDGINNIVIWVPS